MLTEKEKLTWDAIDEIAAKQGYVTKPKRPHLVEYDYHAMSNYAHKKGVKSINLTEKEREMFRYQKPIVYA